MIACKTLKDLIPAKQKICPSKGNICRLIDYVRMFDTKIKWGLYLCRAPGVNQNTQVVIDLQALCVYVLDIFEGFFAAWVCVREV